MKTKYCLSILFLLVLANHFCFAQDTILTKKQLRKKQREYSVGVLGTFENYPLETNNAISNRVKIEPPPGYTVIEYVDAKDLPYKPSYAFGYGLTYQQNLPIISPNFIVGANLSYGSKGTYYYSDLGFGYGYHSWYKRYISYHSSTRFQKTNYYYKPELFLGYTKQLKPKLNAFANLGFGIYLFDKIIIEEYDFIDNSLLTKVEIDNKFFKESEMTKLNGFAVTNKTLFNYETYELKQETNFNTVFLQAGFNYNLSKHFNASLSLYFRKENRRLPIPESYTLGANIFNAHYYHEFRYNYLYNYKQDNIQLTTQLTFSYAF